MATGIISASDIKIGSVGSNSTATVTFSNSQCCMLIGMRRGSTNVLFCRLYEVWNNSPMNIVNELPTGFDITKDSRVITMTNNATGVGAVPFIAIGASDIRYA